MIGGHRKKCYRLGELFRDLGFLFPRMTDIWDLYAKRGMGPLFREEIIVAVARTNECRLCTRVHTEWALSAGMAEGDRGEIAGSQPSLRVPIRTMSNLLNDDYDERGLDPERGIPGKEKLYELDL